MTKQLRLGVVGLSEGNGHPYSWSAIFNGYNLSVMEQCGFPVIPRYLEKQRFPEDQILEAKVTHIWTQSRELSEHIASATFIKHIVSDLHDLIGNVDAILLARDDADLHVKMATPFLKSGIPVYIDKPLALTMGDAKKLISLQQYDGQLFSCSALRYAEEFRLTEEQRNTLGKIQSIYAFVPKDWNKYAVHVIEPLLQLIPDRGKRLRNKKWILADRTSLMVEFENGIDAHIHTCGQSSAPLTLRIIGSDGWTDLFFVDTFKAFRATLQDFILGVINRDVRTPPGQMLDVVELIELGRRA